MSAAPPLPPSQPPGQVPAASVLPPDHQLGMKVPKGGSMCANCEYLADPQTCGNPGFVKWNGSGQLPAPADEYCCDLWEGGKAAPAGPTGASGGPQDMMVAALKGDQPNG